MMDDACNQEIPCPVKQLWSMTPIGAAWTESMQLGGQLHGQAIDEFYQELYDSNVRLNGELGAMRLHLQFARDAVESSRAANRALVLSLQEANAELAATRTELQQFKKEREEQEELDKLACDIWGPAKRSKPDGSWDPPPVLLSPEPPRCKSAANPSRSHPLSLSLSSTNPSDPPVAVGRIAAELGFKSDASHVHRISGHVREAFMRAHGRAPEPLVYYDDTGAATRIGCFTERDRELIASVVRQHGERI
jgi:hypothetical protein